MQARRREKRTAHEKESNSTTLLEQEVLLFLSPDTKFSPYHKRAGAEGPSPLYPTFQTHLQIAPLQVKLLTISITHKLQSVTTSLSINSAR